MNEIMIITHDARLGQVLAYEAAACGAKSEIRADAQGIAAEEWNEIRVTIVDLDSKLGGSIPEHVRVLGLCQDPENLSLRARRTAHMLFRRPVRMADLRREITHLLVKHEGKEQASAALRENGVLQLQMESKCVLLGNRQISLSDKEFSVLSLLVERGDRGVSKQELSALLDAEQTNEAQVYICRLRQKLEQAFGMRLIKTVRNYGYVYGDYT